MLEMSDNKGSSNKFICSPENLSLLIGPYGYIQCTCEKYPKITHINTQMIEYLGRSEKKSDLTDFLHENIFFTIIPFEERDIFKGYLKQALNSDKPIRIEHQIRCGDGSCKSFFGWLSVVENNDGEKEYAFIYSLKYSRKRELENNAYFNALKNTYNIIFEINPVDDIIECIHGKETSEIGYLYDVVMTLPSARDFWINNFVIDEDKAMMRKFLEYICSPNSNWDKSSSVQSRFRLKWTDGIVYNYMGIAIRLEASSVLFCVNRLVNPEFTAVYSKEVVALKKLDQWLEHIISDDKEALGMFLYEKNGDDFHLIYASEEIRNHLKISQDDYFRYITNQLPQDKCAEISRLKPSNFEKLIQKKQINYTINISNNETKDVVLTCNVYNNNGSEIYEILVHDENTLKISDVPSSGIFARTFGYFDLFIDGQPITFTNSKEKELMALLIDRNGGTLTTNDAISILWEDEEINERTSTKYRKLAMGLKNTLAKHNADHIIINHHGVRNIDVSAITCDYYELLAGNKHYQKLFHNLYMTNYSWAEDTLATLWDYS